MKKTLAWLLTLCMILSMIPMSVFAADADTGMTGGEKLYLRPNANWLQSDARFAAYFHGGSNNTWAGMTEVEGETDLYEVTVPDGSWTNVIFCRMNPATTENNWNNKWNQTGELTYDGTNNLCTIKDGQWDCGTNVTWSIYESEPTDPIDPETDTVTLYFKNTGNWSTVFAYVWDNNNSDVLAT